MMEDLNGLTVTELYEQAIVLVEQGQRRQAGAVAYHILQQEYTHEEAWQMVHNAFGMDLPFADFKRVFTRKFLPEQWELLPR